MGTEDERDETPAERKNREAEEYNAKLPNQTVMTLAGHITAWAETYGDDVMEQAITMAEQQREDALATRRDATADAAEASVAAGATDDAAVKAAADRAAAGTPKTSAPRGRSASAPK